MSREVSKEATSPMKLVSHLLKPSESKSKSSSLTSEKHLVPILKTLRSRSCLKISKNWRMKPKNIGAILLPDLMENM